MTNDRNISELEDKIYLFKDEDKYHCFLGNEQHVSQRFGIESLDGLKNYVMGLIDASYITTEQIVNGASKDISLAGGVLLPPGDSLNNQEYQEIIEYVSPEKKHDGNWC